MNARHTWMCSAARQTALAALLGLQLVACGHGSFSDAPDAGSTGDAGAVSSDAGPRCTPTADDLATLYARYLDARQPTGCSASGCHGTGSGGLTFRNANELWSATVNVPATSNPSEHRVAVGDPASSLFFQRMLASAPSRMPPGGPYLDDAALAELSGWICAGAPAPDAGPVVTDGGAPDAGQPDAGSVVVVSGFSPSSGLVGTQVTVTGSGFSTTPADNQVSFNGVAAPTPSSATATELITTVPTGATSGPVSVTAHGTTGNSTSSFQVLSLNAVPVLSSLSPASVTVGAAGLTLTLAGTGFVSGASASLDGAGLPTTFVSSTQLTAAVAATAFAATGTHLLTVTNPSPGGGTSGAVSLAVVNPAPQLTSSAPTTVAVGAAAQTLTLTGTGFVSASVAKLDGASLPTTFVNATQLTASVSAASFAQAGAHQLTVATPAPGGGTSSALAFSVTNPAPVLSSISPATVPTGGAAFSLTLTGSAFVSTSTVQLDGAPVTTTFVNAGSLTAQMPAFASAGTHSITVVTPAPGGGTSTATTLTVQTLTTPFISTLSPNPATAAASFSLTLAGANFTCTGGGPTVLLNASSLMPSSCSATQLVVTVPATAAGSASVQVKNPNTSTSNTVTLTLVAPNPVPTLASLSPASVSAGASAFTLTVNGSNFVSGATVSFNGAARTTTFVSSAQVTASISATDVASAGSASVTVTNPAPGGGLSTALTLSVIAPNPVPTLGSVSPNSASAGAAAFTLTVTGTNFVSGASVSFGGAARTTTFTSSTQLTAAILAGDVASAGSFPVTVANPAPGGGTSSPVSFTVAALNLVPVLASLSPSTLALNSGATTLTVTGSGFISGTQVIFAGAPRTTTFVSATTVSVALLSADAATAGSFSVAATNPSPGGGASNALALTVASVNPTPTVALLSPCGVVAGAGQVSVTVTGTGFLATSTVTFGGTAVTASVASATSLTATVPASLVTSAPVGNALAVVVTNPTPGGGASNSETFGVASAVSTLSATVQPIFNASCTTAMCHSTAGLAGGLDLTSGKAAASLVGVLSTGCTSTLRVKACGPGVAQSVLLDKIISATPCSGTGMPKGAPLTAPQKQKIVDWVAQGAK